MMFGSKQIHFKTDKSNKIKQTRFKIDQKGQPNAP